MGEEFKDFEVEAPVLTLEPDLTEEKEEIAKKEPEKPQEPAVEEPVLSPQEQKIVEDFAAKIDIENTNQILQYGAGTQKKMADFSDAALVNVKTQDLGEAGELLANVVGELKDFDATEEKGFFGFFKKQTAKVETLKNRYTKAEGNVTKITEALEQHQMRLMKDSAVLDKMYEQNLAYFKELSMYILAGKKKLREVRMLMGEEFKDFEVEAPVLTLEPDLTEEKEEIAKKEPEKPQEPAVEEPVLSPQEQKIVEDFAAKIDIENTNQILQYGAGTQKKMADFSDAALVNVKTQDLGEAGELLANVVGELKDFDATEEKGFFGFFKKQTAKVETLKNRYTKAEGNVTKITEALEQHQMRLMKDSAVLDKMYEQNLAYFKELSMYILAGKKKLREVREGKLNELHQKAAASGLPEDAQAANDLESKCDRFEKKLHDLELTRTISMQTAPQIRMIQNNDTTMIEKIQTTIVNTIPLWKSQMVLALGIAHSTEAAQAQRQVTDFTNELLKKNAETLHLASVETAKESQRGIVDIETLKKTNQELIQTLDDVMKIQQEGREKRQAAEADMRRMENELKTKLLEIRR